MGIGAISGYGMQDYSWYTPGGNVAEDGEQNFLDYKYEKSNFERLKRWKLN